MLGLYKWIYSQFKYLPNAISIESSNNAQMRLFVKLNMESEYFCNWVLILGNDRLLSHDYYLCITHQRLFSLIDRIREFKIVQNK